MLFQEESCCWAGRCSAVEEILRVAENWPYVRCVFLKRGVVIRCDRSAGNSSSRLPLPAHAIRECPPAKAGDGGGTMQGLSSRANHEHAIQAEMWVQP